MPTVCLTLAYDGTHYSGWQRQKNAHSVQSAVESALGKLARQPVTVIGSGRTDTGVHALGQVAHVRLPHKIPTSKLYKALNDQLPRDIVVRKIRYVSDNFHARFHAVRKHYRYRIVTGQEPPLFERAYVYYLPIKLNAAAMREAAQRFIGKHDFKAFHSTGRPVKTTFRTISRFDVKKRGKELILDVEADGFLYHMVRRLAGVLIEIGKGRWQPSDVDHFFKKLPGKWEAPTAPARGLCLMEVWYGKEA